MDTFVKFKVGDKVSNLKKDYRFDGEVRAVFKTIEGHIRYVVEELRINVLHIYETFDIDFTCNVRTVKEATPERLQDDFTNEVN